MAYTTKSTPVLIGRPGYSAEHYDFAFSGLGVDDLPKDKLYDAAQYVLRLGKAGEYKKAGEFLSRLSSRDRKDILENFLPGQLSADEISKIKEQTTAGGRAFSFLKGAFATGPSAPGAPAAPPYLLIGGLAVGGLLLLLLLTKKPKPAAAPAPK